MTLQTSDALTLVGPLRPLSMLRPPEIPGTSPVASAVLAGLLVLAAACAVPPPEPELRLATRPARETIVEAGALFAERITADNAQERLVGGPHADGGLGDWALGNGVVCAVVSDRDHEAVLSATGGLLVDLGNCGREDDQFTVLQLHMFNLERERIIAVDHISAEVFPDRVQIRTRGQLDGIEAETTYELDTRSPEVLRITSRIRRVGDGDRLFILGDTTIHGGRSLAPFVLSTRTPTVSKGFAHSDSDPDRISSIVSAIHPGDLHVLVGTEDDGPGISYGLLAESAGLIDEDGSERQLAFLALNGESFTLQAVFTRPLWTGGWENIGWLQFGQTPFMNLKKGETLEIRRALLVSRRADVASITDHFFAEQPSVTARVDDPNALIHIRRRIPLFPDAPFTAVRPEPDGRVSFRAPPGRYVLRARSLGRDALRRIFRVGESGVDLGDLETMKPATLLLPGSCTCRLVFEGLGDTPDPRFDDDLLDFRVGSQRYRNAAASRDVSLAGNQHDVREVDLAPGRYRVFATRGPEYEVTRAEIELSAGESRELEIAIPERAFTTPGWISADLHVHAGPSFDSSLPLDERVRTFVAQGGEVVVSTEHNTIVDYGPVIRRLGLEGELASVVGTEITSTASTTAAPHTIGHSNAFPVTEQRLLYRRGALQGEGRRLRDVVRQARAAGPDTLLQLNHPRNPVAQPGGDHFDTADYFTHLAVAGEAFRPDRLLSEAPNAVLLEPDPTTKLRDLDFDLIELMNGPSRLYYRRMRADWLSLLLQGEFRTATANSDSHGAETPVALPRTYVRLADDDIANFERAAFLASLREGRVVGTTGPWLDVALGGVGPGETWREREGELHVRVRAASWVDVSTLRVRVNGELVHTGETEANGVHSFALRFDSDAFVTVEVEGEPGDVYASIAPGATPLAYTNPIFVDADADGTWTAPGLPDSLPAVLTDPDHTP